MLRSYRELEVWQEAMNLAEEIYRISADFPPAERYGLVSQIRRASVSVPSNIVEGHARPTTRDYLRFLGISLGSLAEMETQLLLAHRLDYIDSVRLDQLLRTNDRVGRMLRGLKKSLDAKLVLHQPPVPSP